MTRTRPAVLFPATLAFCGAAWGLAAAAGATDDAGKPAQAANAGATSTDKPAAAPAPRRSRAGFEKGRSRITLYGGWSSEGEARSENIDTIPLTATATAMRVKVKTSPVVGLEYSYKWNDHWAVELGWEEASTKLMSKDKYDAVEVARVLAASNLDATQQATLADRLAAHAGPYDLSLSFFDVSVTRVFKPGARWIGEGGGGIGYAHGAIKGGKAIFETLVHSYVDPANPSDLYTVANEITDPTGGQACPADDDPCVALKSGGGLTFNAYGGVSFAFNDHVHLRLMGRVRNISRVVDPGNSFIIGEGTVGIAFLFGGR